MNNAYLRKLVSDELRDVLMLTGTVEDYHCKTKVVDNNGKTKYYAFVTNFGTCKVVGARNIYVNDKKCKNLTEARQTIYKYL